MLSLWMLYPLTSPLAICRMSPIRRMFSPALARSRPTGQVRIKPSYLKAHSSRGWIWSSKLSRASLCASSCQFKYCPLSVFPHVPLSRIRELAQIKPQLISLFLHWVLENMVYFQEVSLITESSLYVLVLFFFFFWTRVDLQCFMRFRCAATVNQLCKYICPFFFSHIGYYRILSRFPCAMP